jgi:hypothetical protein
MGRVTCESSFALDIRALARRDYLQRMGLEFPWFWHDGTGCLVGHVSIHIEADAVLLSWKATAPSGTGWIWPEQLVPIEWTNCNFGGRRPWFVCECGSRVAVLYRSGSQFSCRRCCDLTYGSQLRTPQARSIERARKLRMQLGGGPDLGKRFPPRPFRMHRRTYARLRASCEEATADAFSYLRFEL